MTAADIKHVGVPHVAVNVDSQVGCAAAQIHDRHAHGALGIGQDHFSGG